MEMFGKSQQEVKNSGIYRITCVANNHFYYGSSINLKSRFRDHINKLRAGSHRNNRLQRIFDKYGEASLTFEVIKYCDSDFVLDSEQEYLNEYASSVDCVNFCKDAKAPMAGLKFSDEHKKKMSDSQVRNKYTFYYACGKVESFNSLKLAGDRFGVKRSIVSKWFKRKNLGRNHGILQTSSIIKAEKFGDKCITLLPYQYKQESWVLAKASSKSNYYRKKRLHAVNGSAGEANQ
jgi:group I intron endonuclease